MEAKKVFQVVVLVGDHLCGDIDSTQSPPVFHHKPLYRQLFSERGRKGVQVKAPAVLPYPPPYPSRERPLLLRTRPQFLHHYCAGRGPAVCAYLCRAREARFEPSTFVKLTAVNFGAGVHPGSLKW